MEVPLQEIFALVSYVHADIENGVQLEKEWIDTVEKVRVWAVAFQQNAHPTLLKSGENPATWVIDPNNITPPAISG